jgi:16S rRNA (guanine966-N2)-methyltransferase
MRIIAGERRGHTLQCVTRRDLRPTTDRVRESIFNILRDEVEGRLVLDIFAGTGALGMESLSRGADRVIFVERDRTVAALIRKNLEHLRYEARGTLVLADAAKWVRGLELPPEVPVIAFVDPPYRLYREARKPMVRVLADLAARLPIDSRVVMESSIVPDDSWLPSGVDWDVRHYGNTYLSVGTVVGVNAVAIATEATEAGGDSSPSSFPPTDNEPRRDDDAEPSDDVDRPDEPAASA